MHHHPIICMHQEGIIPLDLQPFAGPRISGARGGQPFHSIHMESAVLGGQLDLWQQLEEDLGQPMRWGDDAWAVRCVHCNICFPNLKQYRWHVDHYPPHRRRSPLLIKKQAKLINEWEQHCTQLRAASGEGKSSGVFDEQRGRPCSEQSLGFD